MFGVALAQYQKFRAGIFGLKYSKLRFVDQFG